jgi:hypothetical protein
MDKILPNNIEQTNYWKLLGFQKVLDLWLPTSEKVSIIYSKNSIHSANLSPNKRYICFMKKFDLKKFEPKDNIIMFIENMKIQF